MKTLITITQLFLLISFFKFFRAENDNATKDIIITLADIKVAPGNPYIGNWTVQIDNSGKTLSMKTPITQRFPDDMMVLARAYFEGNLIIELGMSMCDALSEPTYAPSVRRYIKPEGEFPDACPILKNENFEVLNFVGDASVLPPELPEGEISSEVTIYQPNVEPYVVMKFKALLQNKT